MGLILYRHHRTFHFFRNSFLSGCVLLFPINCWRCYSWCKSTIRAVMWPISSFFIFILSYASVAESFLRSLPSVQKYSKSAPFSRSIEPRLAQSSDNCATRPAQLLEFTEPETNTTVLLVGAMHYNPTSIELARNTIEKLGETDQLASVIVESCPTRWNRTLELRDSERGEMLSIVLNNEMVAASDAASRWNRPLILGDQCINITNSRIGSALKQTFQDMATPLSGGWQRLFDDVRAAAEAALPSGPSYLGAGDFLDSRLLLTMPVSLFRYPLAFLIKAPVSGAIALSLLLAASYNSALDLAADATAAQSLSLQVGEWLASAATVVLEVAFLSRVFLIAILAERNEVLAENILVECKKSLSSSSTSSASSGVVVAVLGMAHCNGVMKLLLEQAMDSTCSTTSSSGVNILTENTE